MFLVDKLKEFKEPRWYSELDRDAEIRKFLDDKRTAYPMLDDVISGRYTFQERVEEVYKPFRRLGAWIPHREDREHNERVDALGDIVYSPVFKTGNEEENKNTFLRIFLKWGVVPTVAASIVDYILFKENWGILTAIVGTIMGGSSGCAGLSSTSITSLYRGFARADAKYLDETIQRVYEKSSAPV